MRYSKCVRCKRLALGHSRWCVCKSCKTKEMTGKQREFVKLVNDTLKGGK